ncbi:MAG: peptide-methionine (S)-S-oxide reductase MsrA, partial [Bacteroidota bacterium]|nr:peptide-methionine (S)-S-oxide reductase MsrA [Bacteroidota bacterium]
ILAFFLLLSTLSSGCSAKQDVPKNSATVEVEPTSGKNFEHATFALGCFWHSEEIFLEIKGVKEALPGYCGGTEPDPTYELVGTGTTGYAESVDVTYDPAVISYQKLLEVFFTEHDPTTPNMAYPDEGPQYRSVIFYRNDSQKKDAESYIARLSASHKFEKPIITQVSPFTNFYKAEDYHIRYFRHHPSGQSYIDNVTRPEVEKFRKDFPELVKADL